MSCFLLLVVKKLLLRLYLKCFICLCLLSNIRNKLQLTFFALSFTYYYSLMMSPISQLCINVSEYCLPVHNWQSAINLLKLPNQVSHIEYRTIHIYVCDS